MTSRVKFTTDYMDDALFDLQGVVREAEKTLKPVADEFDTLVGTGFSGGVIVPALALRLRKGFVLVRKDNDDSHHQGRILGDLGERWIFVDDFVASGRTRDRVIENIERAARDREHQTRLVGRYFYARHLAGYRRFSACRQCGMVDVNGDLLGGTDECPPCVAVTVHNYRALHDGRMKTRDYPSTFQLTVDRALSGPYVKFPINQEV